MRSALTIIPIVFVHLIPLQSGEVQSQLNPDHSFRVAEENGVLTAINTGGPKYLGEIFRYEQVLVLKEDPSRPETLVGRAREASRLGEDGSIYIHDISPRRIARFSSDGEYLNDIGRMGQGPGEYESPVLLSVTGSEVTIFDPYHSRISIFRPDGSLVKMISTPLVRRRLSFRAAYPMPDGGFLLVDNQTTYTMEDYQFGSLMLILFSVDLDTLAVIQVGPVKGPYIFNRGYAAGRIFGGSPNVEFHHERGIYTSTGFEPTITVHDFSGNILKIIDAGIPPERVNREERRTVTSTLRKWLDEADTDEEKARARGRLDHVEFCDPKAFWDDMIVDENGHIWAELPNYRYYIHVPDIIGYNNRQLRVFSPEGEYLGITKVPTRGSISRGHFIALQDNEETGGIDVVLYRIQPAVAGLQFPE